MLTYETMLQEALERIHRRIDARVAGLLEGKAIDEIKLPRLRPNQKQKERKPRVLVGGESDLLEKTKTMMRWLETCENRKRQHAGSQRMTNFDLAAMRAVGVHTMDYDFAHETNPEFCIAKIDPRLGIPSVCYAVVPTRGTAREPGEEYSEFALVRIQEVAQLPHGLAPSGPGYGYEMQMLWGFPKSKAAGLQWHFTVDNDGYVHPCWYAAMRNANWRGKRDWHHRHYPQFSKDDSLPADKGKPTNPARETFAFMVSDWQQMHMSPIVEIVDGAGRRALINITMGALKTEFSGRSRADGHRIMHWVRAHDRDGSGVINTHMRGRNTFEWEGYHVSVYMPGERKEAHSKAQAAKMRPMLNKHGMIAGRVDSITRNPVLAQLFGMTLVTREGEREAEESNYGRRIPNILDFVVEKKDAPHARIYYKQDLLSHWQQELTRRQP